MKLISMTEFVLEQEKKSYTETEKYRIIEWQTKCEVFDKFINYANFINQPLTLGMFVPCDEDGNVLIEPKFYYKEEDLKHFKGQELQVANRVNEKCKQYQQAKDKVLFEGFGIENEKFFDVSFYDVVRNKDTYVFVKDKEWEKVNDYNTIEDLVLYELPLTPNAIKQFNL